MEHFHLKLNSVDYLPAEFYRRNTKMYELVSYVNNLVACYASNNTAGMLLFIERAREFLKENPATPKSERYYGLVRLYINTVEQSLTEVN